MNPSTDQADVIVDELIRCGVRDAVLCPGSRNAPLAFALHAADTAGRLRLHVRIDERSAGFLASGLAMRSGSPVPVVCTSGTAAANLHPAVLEADHAGLPLLAVTADRPVELRGTGAGQTIDQHGMFGNALRCFAEMPTADTAPPRYWRTTVDRVVSRALGSLSHDPGPVQLNVPLREPLVPDHLSGPDPAPGRGDGHAWSAVVPGGNLAGPLPLSAAATTLVIAGQGGDGAVPPELPVLAEPGSPLWHRSLRSGPLLLAEALSGSADHLLPEQVVVLGRPTMHRSVQRLLADDRVAVFAVPPVSGGRFRPLWTDVPGAVRAVGDLPAEWAPPREFGDRWRFADAAACAAIDRVESCGTTTGPQLARAVLAGVPPGSQVFAGPSHAIRDVALAADPRPDVTVLANRGVAGIDGVVSSAVGAALAHDGPSYALVGDLTFLHDSNGLLIGPDEPEPQLTIVVANDDGGSIFTVLEQGAAAYASAFERLFGTPQRVDIAALCAACGVEHVLAEDLADLTTVLAETAGLRVVEVPVDRTNRRELHEHLRSAAENAIAGGEPLHVTAISP